MDINEIIDYVLNTPGNTNAAVLKSMVETYAEECGGDMPPSGSDVVYDGGEEV